jgi:uncharacterized protein
MELKGEENISLDQGLVWAGLNDPEVLKASIPGCESLEVTADGFRIVMLAAVGPVRARFNGKLSLMDVAPPHSYTLVFEGTGGVAGFGKGRAEVQLQAVGEGTRLVYIAKAQVGGKIAQVGSRLIDGVAARMAAEFFARFKERITPVSSAAAPTESVEEGGRVPDGTRPRGTFWKMLAFWRWWPRRSGG